jgi:PKD repeat protein
MLVLACLVSNAQQDKCGSVTYLHAQQQADPTLITRMQQIEQFTQNYIQNNANSNSRAVVSIPVVFHVVYSSSAQNISDAKCQAQIDQLNLDYARLNADAANTPSAFASLAVNTNIQFCLAVRDPNGNSTTGVIHKSTTTTSFSTNDKVKYTAQGGDDAWPASSYLNIWTCNLSGGVLGYAQFPGGAAATDGVVVLYSSVGSVASPTSATPYNKGRTATHEVGHWLNLYHIWGDDGGSCSGSDNVNDTPNQGSENYGCPSFPHTDNCSASSPGVMFMNYMDYTDDGCMNMFTQGQSTRMNALFSSGGARYSLLSSQGCVTVGPPCGLATGMNTTNVTANTATFTWTAVSGAASYTIQYRPVGTSTWLTGTSTTASYNAINLIANTNYEWQVKTICSNGGSSSFTTSTTFYTSGPPVAGFRSDVTSTCTGVVKFTDISTGAPTSWLWTFGDGVTSTAQNPTHLYVTNGTFTVSLTVTNTYGNNTATTNNYITINKPAAPIASDASRCGQGTVSLSVNTTDTIKWYAGPNDTTPVSMSNPFVTPVLNNTTTYYAEELVAGANLSVGPTTNTSVGGGSYFNNNTDRYLIFNCTSACVLQSVKVYAQANQTNVIVLRDASGTILQSYTATLTAGANTVPLNFNIPVGTNLRLAVNGTANLYRNNAGAVFPYTLAGYVSITGTNATAGYYYYFYNWQIVGPSCVSLRKAVNAVVSSGPTATSSVTNVTCNGGSNGSVAITPTGGTPTYTYLWSNGQTTAQLTNVAAGTYTVSITDATSCIGTATATISQPTAVSASIATTSALCGQTDGSASVTATGGNNTAYSYLWSNSSTASSINNVAPGSYSVTVTDANSCTGSATANIGSSGNFTISAAPTAATCFGAGNGSIAATVTGSGPYTYLWSNGQTTASISNVAAGTYTVTATDGSGCSGTQSAVVTEPAQISLTATATDAGCGQSTGSALVTVTGGGSYTYLWSNSSTTANISNVQPGGYSVTVTDANSCTASAAVTINQTTALNLNANAVYPLCAGDATGSMAVSPSGGTAPYTYLWNTTATTGSLNNLTAGTYAVTVTDANNCSSVYTATLTEPAALTAIATTTNVNCYGDFTGTANLTVAGGTPGYTYMWSNGETTAQLTNAYAGNYTVTITDTHNCTTTKSVTINEPATGISISITTNTAGQGASNGSAIIDNLTGGTAPYTILWSDGQTAYNAVGLAAGTYTVTVTDATGCSKTATVTVSEVTGIATIGNNLDFGIYPNPANTEITFTYNLQQAGTLTIHNVLGQTMYTDKLQQDVTKLKLNVGSFAAGVYYVELNSDGKTQVKQLIINR